MKTPRREEVSVCVFMARHILVIEQHQNITGNIAGPSVTFANANDSSGKNSVNKSRGLLREQFSEFWNGFPFARNGPSFQWRSDCSLTEIDQMGETSQKQNEALLSLFKELPLMWDRFLWEFGAVKTGASSFPAYLGGRKVAQNCALKRLADELHSETYLLPAFANNSLAKQSWNRLWRFYSRTHFILI